MPSNKRRDAAPAEALLAQVYTQLRDLAHRYMRDERAGHSLQPTALVHEAYIRLVERHNVEWQSKTHFFAIAAREMRRVLVDHARAASAAKRGAEQTRVAFDEGLLGAAASVSDVLAIDEALTRLEKASPRQSQVAEMRLFSGMFVQEVAQVLGVSATTVKDDWRVARAWLAVQLG